MTRDYPGPPRGTEPAVPSALKSLAAVNPERYSALVKRIVIISIALLVAGCASKPATRPELTMAEAGILAQQLANIKAQSIYQCSPFNRTVLAQWVPEGWYWHDRRGWGTSDYEATVKLASDGTKPEVTVVRLVNQR